jgi:hypothetical protein
MLAEVYGPQSNGRVASAELVMTKKIADMRGVRREGVTERALDLQDAGLMK